MGPRLNRRGFLGMTAGAAFGVWTADRAHAAGNQAEWLSIEVAADAEAVSAIVPPPLRLSTEPRIRIDCRVEPVKTPSLLHPEPNGWAGVFLSVVHGDEAGWYPVGMWSSSLRDRLVAREALGLPVKDGAVEIQLEGETVSVVVRRGQRVLLRASAAAAATEPSEGSAPVFAFSYRLAPKWSEEIIDAQGAALRRFELLDRAEVPSGDPAAASVEWGDASPLDPLAEIPLGEILASRYSPAAAALDLDAHQPESLAQVAAEELAPWAFSGYDRPISRERAWMPAGWRQTGGASAFRFSNEERTRYHARREIILEPLDIVEIDASVRRETYAALLPPICRVSNRPRIKILGLRVGGGDVSAEMFTEAWLFVYGAVEGRPAWYALSHLVGPGGDVSFGRDVFGYPSKPADPDVFVSPVDFSLSAQRLDREIVFAGGGFEGFASGTTLAQAPIVCLQPVRGTGKARLIYQQWHYQGRRSRVDRNTLQLEFSEKEGAFGKIRNDPWFDLNPVNGLIATVMDSGVMQRSPGEVVGEIDGYEAFYRERCDGVLPWETEPASPVQPTLIADPQEPTSRT